MLFFKFKFDFCRQLIELTKELRKEGFWTSIELGSKKDGQD